MFEISAVRKPAAVHGSCVQLAVDNPFTAKTGGAGALLQRPLQADTAREKWAVKEKSDQSDKLKQTEKVRTRHGPNV